MTTDASSSALATTALAADRPSEAADGAASLRRLEAELLAMPPVAALELRVDGYDGASLRLSAPLAANVNDKGCAFGGSLVSLMTLAGWGLVTAKLLDAGIEADVYVADSEVRYRAPLYADLHAVAALAEGEGWPAFVAMLRERGKARLEVLARIDTPDGIAACESRSRYVAKRRVATE